MAAIRWSATSAMRNVQRARRKGGCPTGRHTSRQRSPPKNKVQADEFIPYSARCPVGNGEVRHSPLKAPQLRAWWRISTEPLAWSVQCAMSHELCLYRSDAARQGSVVLLLKISMVLMKKLMALLSHSEAFAPLLLEVAECGGQLPSNPGACCKLVAIKTVRLAISAFTRVFRRAMAASAFRN